jgi:hypothetical protein
VSSPTIGSAFSEEGRMMIVKVSLAGLQEAGDLQDEGHEGLVTIIGDVSDEPYDRPAFSSQVLKECVPGQHANLPRMRRVKADWRLSTAAIGLDHCVFTTPENQQPVHLLRRRPEFVPAAVEDVLQPQCSVRLASSQTALDDMKLPGPPSQRVRQPSSYVLRGTAIRISSPTQKILHKAKIGGSGLPL